MSLDDEQYDPDVLAILKRGDVHVIFLSVDESGIDGKDFSVISWTTDRLTIAVSDQYLQKEVDTFIVEGLRETLSEGASESEMDAAVKEHTVKLFSKKLALIFEEAISSVTEPIELNLDYVIDLLLDAPDT